MELIKAYLENQPSPLKRPLPRDPHIPRGYERINGIIMPEKKSSFEQQFGMTPMEYLAQRERQIQKRVELFYKIVSSLGIISLIITIIMKGMHK